MNKIIDYLLKGSRKFYNWLLNSNRNYSVGEHNPDVASEMIFNLLSKDRPCMIARIGATEMACVVNYIGGRLNSYKDFFNDDWIYPNQDTIPLDVVLEEDNGSYWK